MAKIRIETLDEYLTRTGESNAEFARRIESTPQAVGHWRNGKRIPRDKETFDKISDATNHAVTPNSFYASGEARNA